MIKEDDMKVKELIQLVNNEGMDIYQLSVNEGFSKGTLRQRLLRLGYKYNRETDKWYYAGADGSEPLDKEISYPSRRKQYLANDEKDPIDLKEHPDLFSALLQLPFENFDVTNSFKTNKALVDRMKTFIKQVSLPSGKIYSLAIYEFLKKYEPIIEKFKK